MESGWKNDDLLETYENDESGSAIRSELADEGMINPNSTSNNPKVAEINTKYSTKLTNHNTDKSQN